jgi:hypothetical protein
LALGEDRVGLGRGCNGESTGTKDGSKATGKLAVLRAARASRCAVRSMAVLPKGSSAAGVAGRRCQWNRAAWMLCGSFWPIESTVTRWLPLSTVVVIDRSMGAKAGPRHTTEGLASRPSALFS